MSEKQPVQTNSSIHSSSNNEETSKQYYQEDDIEKRPTNDDDDYEDSSSEHKVYHSRGVQRIENIKVLMDTSKKGNLFRILLSVSLLICAWVYSLDSSTTYNYGPYATSSFKHHSMLSTLNIATSIMSSVCKPIIAKFADITSRPITYILVLALYVMGYIIVASSSTISAYVIGEVFVAIGGSSIQLLNQIIAADLTPLKYRGLLLGILSSPYLITTWFAGLIVEAILGKGNWRWGYGMFAIIMPVAITPAIVTMLWLDRKAFKLAEENRVAEVVKLEIPKEHKLSSMSLNEWCAFLWQQTLEVDLFGLILMGFGWSLLLLPFSLYENAANQWKNPSLIAMLVVGALLLIIYTVYEFWFAPYPSMPKRVLLNRTFMTAVSIDFFYQCGGMVRLLYFSSYVWVIKNWTNQEWTYFNNTLTMGLCFFGVIVGIVQRVTHRCKYIQVFGLSIQVVSMGITLWARGKHASTAALAWTQILIGIGGACSVVGSQVASQASVPHQDTALVIALLSQWSSIGHAIGSAIAGAIWTGKMPGNLRKNLPDSVSDSDIQNFFASITSIRQYPYDSEIRQGAIKAYSDTAYYLFLPALILTIVPFLTSLFQKNFYLGDNQNAIECKTGEQTKLNAEVEAPKNFIEKIAFFFDEPAKFFKNRS